MGIVSTTLTGLAIAAKLPLAAAPFSCTAPTWVGKPAVNSQNQLEAKIQSTCTLKPDSAGSISALNQSIVDSISKENTVNSGPTPESRDDLSGVSFDVTNVSEQEGDQVTIRKDLHLDSDGTSRILYVAHATSIEGSGNAAFLKALDITQEVTQGDPEQNVFTLTVTQAVKIEKPWYAPAGVFLSQGTSKVKSSFTSLVNGMAGSMTQGLTASAPTNRAN